MLFCVNLSVELIYRQFLYHSKLANICQRGRGREKLQIFRFEYFAINHPDNKSDSSNSTGCPKKNFPLAHV